MRFLRRAVLAFSVALLAACASISDGTRAIAYGWVDVSDVPGARLDSVMIFNYGDFVRNGMGTAADMRVSEFEGGYVFWHFDVGMGQYAISNFQTQTCLVICGPINEYRLDQRANAPTRIDVTGPEAYYMGSYVLSGATGNLLTRGTFDFRATNRGPSRAEILRFLQDRAGSNSTTSQILATAR